MCFLYWLQWQLTCLPLPASLWASSRTRPASSWHGHLIPGTTPAAGKQESFGAGTNKDLAGFMSTHAPPLGRTSPDLEDFFLPDGKARIIRIKHQWMIQSGACGSYRARRMDNQLAERSEKGAITEKGVITVRILNSVWNKWAID